MASSYRVGAKIYVVVPDEPSPKSIVVDEADNAWQHRPGPGVQRPWKSTTGGERTWTELVAEGSLKLVHLGEES